MIIPSGVTIKYPIAENVLRSDVIEKVSSIHDYYLNTKAVDVLFFYTHTQYISIYVINIKHISIPAILIKNEVTQEAEILKFAYLEDKVRVSYLDLDAVYVRYITSDVILGPVSVVDYLKFIEKLEATIKNNG